MNCLASNLREYFGRAVPTECENFGVCFRYSCVDFGKISYECVAIEEFLPCELNINGL